MITFTYLSENIPTILASQLFAWTEKYKNVKAHSFSDFKTITDVSTLVTSWCAKSSESDYLLIWRCGLMDDSDIPLGTSFPHLHVALSNDKNNPLAFDFVVLSKEVAELAPFTSIDELILKTREKGLSISERDQIKHEILSTVQLKQR
jgi:hypothetical protein